MPAYLNHIGCAVPPYERQQEFIDSLPRWAGPPDIVEKLQQLSAGARIDQRYTVLADPFGTPAAPGFYRPGEFPGTGERMKMYQREAPLLAARAVDHLRASAGSLETVTHLIVTSCTGFYAPGLDIDVLRYAALATSVQRTLIGFMGCQAALVGLRNARQIVEGDPKAVVLMVNLELCSLHLQETHRMDRLVSFLLFADGCAASLITSQPRGLRLDECRSHLSLADSERMAWHIEDHGFAMTLDARLPARIRQWFRGNDELSKPASDAREMLWAIHPGGRLILDSVQDACGLTDNQMVPSREVLRRFGNMSSASIMFILRDVLHTGASREQQGRALAFGPGLTVEVVDFVTVPALTGSRSNA
ncbi:MAG TPA: type III polyketide synthase [Chthoniobacteraceae bacterium]|nr:type III polyketide synthase [Chthoniobacteraceae bacterium]